MTKCCIAIACLLGLLFQNVACATLAAKQLAGPPSEFSQHMLPTPNAGTLQQQSTYTTSALTCEEKLCGWSTPVVVDNTKEFRFGVFSPFEDKLTYSLVDPNGNQVPIENYANPSQYQLNSDGSAAVPGIVYQIKNPIVGKYQFSVASKEHIAPRENNLPHVAVIVWNESPIEINTRLNSYSMKVGADVGLVSYVADTNVDASAALQEVITTAEMVVLEPDGEELDVQMHDDGLHYDLEANDGVYGAFIKPTVPGTYRLQALVSGKTSSGVEFTRSTEHVIPVVDAELILDSVANSKADSNNEVLNIYLPLSTVKNTNAADTFRPYAEVWGTDSNNELVPACWISTITGIQEVDGAQVLPVQLNLKWLTLAKVQAPLVLKNVYVQDAATFVPVTTATQIAVKTPKNLAEILALPHLASVTEITKEMKVGKNPLPPKSGADKTGIVLVHGYCADNNQFKKYGSDIFTDAYYFENLNSNNPNDRFALLIKDFAEKQGLTSFGLIAHSQGGLASIHLHNYYWSGLEVAQGNRLIQSVGSPYQGNGGAGTAADLGKMFGVSCGANTDMTKDGAALWLSGITTDTRKDTYYFTTTYEQGNFFGDWCNFAMNLILKWPNDGVAEYALAQLPNANNMGNKEKWCHSVDMTYSPQCSDPARNADMNANAAR